MKVKNKIQNWLLQEDLNFLLTNRIPRITLTRLMGWWSHLRHPLIVKGSIAVWRWFTDLDLSEAKENRFDTIHACFTRELKQGVRPVDPRSEVLTSPCDCIVGACGEIRDGMVYQAKGFPYTLKTLLSSPDLIEQWPTLLEGGTFVTMRLTSSMYHRFHSPTDAHLHQITYISGDTWNVNPIALKRVQELFCKNERAVLQMKAIDGTPFLLVPVAAVLVASMRFHAVDVLLNLRYKGPNDMLCRADYLKGQEMGWFEHGSTILMFVPPGFTLANGIEEGRQIRMGQALMIRQS